jgi:hypothetical protein
MTHQTVNFLFCLFVLLFAIRMVYMTWKEPDVFFSQNLKGYIGGGTFIILSLISIFGKFSLFGTVSKWIKNSLKLNAHDDVIMFAYWTCIVCALLFLTYYRPDKMLRKYKVIKNNSQDKIKLLSNYLLFYFGFLLVTMYLIAKVTI